MKKRREKVVLAISGDIAAGKNEMAEYVQKKHGGYPYRSSEVLRDVLGRIYLPETRENMQKMSTALRNYFGEDIISYVSNFDLNKIKNRIIAIDGIRRLSDLKILKKDFKVKLIYIDADLKKRYERIIKRSENTDDGKKTFQEFKKDHKKEAESQIENLRRYADYIIKNNGTLKEFHEKIDEVIKIINK